MDNQFVRDYLGYVYRKYNYQVPEFLSPEMILGISNGLYCGYDPSQGLITFQTPNFIMNLLHNLGFKAWEKFDLIQSDIPKYLEDILRLDEPVLVELENPVEYVTLFPENSSTQELERLSPCIKRWFDVAFPEKLFPLKNVLAWSIYQNTYLYKYPYTQNEGLSGLEAFFHQAAVPGSPEANQAADLLRMGRTHYREPLRRFFEQALELLDFNNYKQAIREYQTVCDLWAQAASNPEDHSVYPKISAAEKQFVNTILKESEPDQ